MLRKKALHGFEALSGMQKAIFYDVEARKQKRDVEEPARDPEIVACENWEMGIDDNPIEDEYAVESEDEAPALGQGAVDEDFKESFAKYNDTLQAQVQEVSVAQDTTTVELPPCKTDSEVLHELIRMHSEGCAVLWPDGVNEIIARSILKARERRGEESTEGRARETCLQVFAIDSDSDM